MSLPRSTGSRGAAARPANEWRIVPLGDRCLIVEFESRVDAGINRKARALADFLLRNPPAGVIDVVPAFCTVAVYYRPEQFAPAASQDPSPYHRLRARIEAVLAAGIESAEGTERVIRIPVCYGGVHGPDLPEVAAACGMTADQVVLAHVASEHVIFMLGFSPGFPYIGGLDPRLSVPRRPTPRTRIPAGTVAIARDQTAIYSFETPGGWNLIGRTPLKLFDPSGDPPCRLQPGDRIRFVPITQAEFPR
jgi:inhibitor of KinA